MAAAERELVIVGAGGFGRETIEAVRAVNERGATWKLAGYLDDDPALSGTLIDGVPVLGGADELADMPDVFIVVCTGRPDNYASRPRIVNRLGLIPERYATIIHPSAWISSTSRIGPGTVVLANTVLTAAVTIGSHVAIMPHVTVTHDDVIEDFATIAAGACLGGNVRVGRGAYIGAGALIREERSIGHGALVGMGAAVTRDIPAGEVWAGVPARPIRLAPPASSVAAG